MWNLKSNTNKCMYGAEAVSQIGKQTWVTQREREDGEGQTSAIGLTDTNYYI